MENKKFGYFDDENREYVITDPKTPWTWINYLGNEVQKLTLRNLSNEAKTIKLYSFVEWCLWNAATDMENFQRNFSTGKMEVDGSVIYHKTEYKERRNHYAFYSVNAMVNGFETKTAANQSVQQSVSGNALVNKTKAKAMISALDTTAKADAAFAQLKAYWDKLLDIYTVKTDEEKLDRMVNIWNQYQCMITFNMSRSASFFESGIGRGMGFRDSNQDLVGFAHQIPEHARERIIDITSTQFPDGGCCHQYQPLTKRGNNDIEGGFNDDPMWLIFGTVAYVKETGDFSLLQKPVPFDNQEGSEVPLFEHLRVSFNHVIGNLGPHMLPLIGRADWNDCLNLNCFSWDPNESFQTTENKTEGSKENEEGQIFIESQGWCAMAGIGLMG